MCKNVKDVLVQFRSRPHYRPQPLRYQRRHMSLNEVMIYPLTLVAFKLTVISTPFLTTELIA